MDAIAQYAATRDATRLTRPCPHHPRRGPIRSSPARETIIAALRIAAMIVRSLSPWERVGVRASLPLSPWERVGVRARPARHCRAAAGLAPRQPPGNRRQCRVARSGRGERAITRRASARLASTGAGGRAPDRGHALPPPWSIC